VGAVLLWVWIAVVVVALVILIAVAAPLLGRLGGLRRAAVKLRRRQGEAMKLQEKAAVLERTVLEVQVKADELQRKIAAIAPGSGRR
jgi:heme exporter protein D